LKHHRYDVKGIEVLKLSALYGANGSGKSNLIKGISLLRDIVRQGRIPAGLDLRRFKLDSECQKEPIEMAMEFFCNTSFYYYSIAVQDNVIVDEYLGEIRGEGKDDRLIFQRISGSKQPSVKFFEGFTNDSENSVLASIIVKDLLKPQVPLLTL